MRTGSLEVPVYEHTWICVCTYRRNDLLAELLGSVRASGDEKSAPRLIIVDNSPERGAEQTVRDAYPEARYVHEPEPGIAQARNAALDAVPEDAHAVVFVDDDERVHPDWLDALLRCARSSGADTVSGPVKSVFPHDAPAWIEQTGFIRRTDFPTGPWSYRPATNNVLVRAEWFLERGFRFDTAFNFTGGEDSDLFERMQAAGAVSWWCAEAEVEEDVPAERLTEEWMRQRGVRAGHVRALKLARRDRGRVRIAAEGAGRLAYGAAKVGARRARRRPVRYTDSAYLREGVGMLQAARGSRYEEYRRAES